MVQTPVVLRKLVPSSHDVQSSTEVDPVATVRPPFGHGSHAVAVLCPSCEKKFAEQVQLVEPGVETEPAAQAMQSEAAALPVTSTYRPAAHAMQLLFDREPVAALPYSPAAQPMQLDWPALPWYLPPGQW